MTEKYGRYFIAIIPAEPWYSEALQLKKEVRDVYESKGALRSPPHITLHMPFRWTLKKLKFLKKRFRRLPPACQHFKCPLMVSARLNPRSYSSGYALIRISLNFKKN